MSSFTISRNTVIGADAGRVHGLINDLRQWQQWSPWEGLDPDLRRDYQGPAAGVGSRYAWTGNRKAGRGSMAITRSTPERIDVDLAFEKPFKARNVVIFDLVAQGDATEVTWTMNGEQTGIGALFAKLFNMDAMLGKDFEKGLAQLKRAAEA